MTPPFSVSSATLLAFFLAFVSVGLEYAGVLPTLYKVSLVLFAGAMVLMLIGILLEGDDPSL